MQIVCVSRGTFGGGKQLAETLAKKLGCVCLSREEINDAATAAGIAVGKLELAVTQRRPLNEWLNIEKERYKAFVTQNLADRALAGPMVYHGRHAHLQLPNVSHVMRVRAIMDADMRTALTMQRLGLPRDKATIYNEQVDEDRARWARTVYNIDWQDPGQYDAVINLSRVKADNAASALVTMTQLPEFQAAPADRRQLTDLSLACRCRLAVGADARTRLSDVQVKAREGRVLLTYLPRHHQLAKIFPEVLAGIDGIGELTCTMASTNLMWVRERFAEDDAELEQIVDLASRWDAAVELVRLGSTEAADAPALESALLGAAQQADDRAGLGGILDDTANVELDYGDPGVNQTMQRLTSSGRVGGFRAVRGGTKELLTGIDRTASYSLVVIGQVFLDKPAPVRKRLTRELIGFLADKLKVPVVEAAELKAHYSFGWTQGLRLILTGAATAGLVALVLNHQVEILSFLTGPGTLHRALCAAALFAFAPVFAYLHGQFSHHVLRLFRFE